MKLAATLVLITALAGCSDPGLYAGVAVNNSGVSVYPAASAKLGSATVTVTP